MLKYIRFMLIALVTYVVTFLMASILNIASGEPFSAAQILWINFLITAPVGIALGLDKETPGLMKRKPRPRAASIMSGPVIATVGLVGLFMAVVINAVIVFGENQYGQVEIGSTMGLVAFSLMLVIVAFESRDQKATVFTTATFDNATLNIVALVEIVLAVLIARGGALTSLLDSQALTDTQWLIGAAPAVVLLLLWEAGKWIARSRSGEAKQAPAAA
jgi:Ca2+-transporting ATPase